MDKRIGEYGMQGWLKAVLILLSLGSGQQVVLASAEPIERPPDDFAGAQYIDSAGCVYRRQGSVWAPRLDNDGSVICGYPPSLPQRILEAGTATEDAALRLSITLAEGLRDADVLDQPAHDMRRAVVETPRARTDTLLKLENAVNAVSTMRVAVAGPAATTGNRPPLCDLLGYGGTSVENRAGGSAAATLGICGGQLAGLQPRSEAGTGIGAGGAGTGRKSALKGDRPSTIEDTSQAAKTMSKDTPRGITRKAKGVAPSAVGKTIKTEDAGPEMVPPGARFVQIGRYPVPVEADMTIGRVADLGYRVVRGTRPEIEAGGRVIMVGPFADRQAVIGALNHLRKTGYPQAFPR